ncbi:MAG: hypothetical protein WDZ34_02300, partial [Candidatus Saccharimonadales bacterium]
MIRESLKIVVIVLATTNLVFGILLTARVSAATFNASHIMSDTAFRDYNSMSAAQIDAFLNSFSSSCISPNKGFKAPSLTGYSPSTGFTYGSATTAGSIIHKAAQVYELNPKVILATLQKEQSLVTGGGGICSDPFSSTARKRYTGAMGYNCPDGGSSYNYSGFELYRINSSVVSSVTGTCVNSAKTAGFSRQIIVATWKLKFNEERSKGNVAWDVQKPGWDNSDDPPTCYNGYMTPGSRARALNSGTSCDQVFSYDGKYTIDTTAVTMMTGATASLYYYTPHIHGNQNFFNIFVSWFGNPNSPCYGTANVSGNSGRQIIANQFAESGVTDLTFTRLNNTGSFCAEAHVWKNNYKSWESNIATRLAATTAAGMIVNANISGDRRDELIFIKYSGSGGKAEAHVLGSSYQEWDFQVATNLPGITASDGTFVAGDFDGNGQDELAFILYSGSTGKVEVHKFSSDLRKAIGVYDVATNLTGVSADTGTFVAGDFLGRGYEQMQYILY